MVKTYVADKGDFIWVHFSPQQGYEQAGRRPGLVITPAAYNLKSGLLLVCPITSQQKHYPFEVYFDTAHLSGVVLADQIKSIDWRARQVAFIHKSDPEVCERVIALVQATLLP